MMTFDILSVILLNIWQEYVTRSSDKNSHNGKHFVMGTSIASTVKLAKKGIDVKIPLLSVLLDMNKLIQTHTKYNQNI